jgi:pyridoxine 5-phosphate synthase
MTRLSVNINKIATLRNARGGNVPDLIDFALKIEKYGANGITVHPRPDERHIKYNDVIALKKTVKNELNIEGNPKEEKFVQLVLDTLPEQVTLVPDSNDQLTSDHGWDTITEKKYLLEIIEVFKKKGIRTSIFVDAEVNMVVGAAETGTDRIELYTENYAKEYLIDPRRAIEPFINASLKANELNIEINAGHDLDLINLNYFSKNIKGLKEVSIGHALISDALIYGMEITVNKYLNELNSP